MHCDRAREWMSLRLDRRLSAREERELQDHLAGCAACAEAWSQWQEIASLFEGAPMVEPPQDLTARVLVRIQEEPRRNALAGSLVVMALGLAVLGVLMLWPLVGLLGTAVSAIQAPWLLRVASSALGSLVEVASALAEVGRLLLWALLRPQPVAAALGYVLLVAITLAGWLRLAVFKRAPVRA
jgi:predicted anti-sigma-YlaC factor YlaD